MWRGHEGALWEYIFACVREADTRGIKTDKNVENLMALRRRAEYGWGSGMPEWFESQEVLNRLVTTHRSNLYKKDPAYYFDFHNAVGSEWDKPCCEKCNYYWVTHKA
jgi:hypothetical protein